MAKQTIFFYDLETSGFKPREARILQFAGQRTDLNLKPIGSPTNKLIRISQDILPDPDAILVTGITPQQTIAEGVSEAEFLKYFHQEVATPGTIFAGYNSIRFDDEFMRFLHYRNFYDAYEWQYTENKGKWDLLDVVRMARALRPDGLSWPFDGDGRPSNRLELLTSVNKISHRNAHDALADVQALIALAQKLKLAQPKLFEYLFRMRKKASIETFVNNSDLFLYTSGKYPSEFEKTTIVAPLITHPTRHAILVYDLRTDPTPFISLDYSQLVERWKLKYDDPNRLPVKTMQFNRCPAIAPIGVLDDNAQKRLKINPEIIQKNLQLIKNSPTFAKNLVKTIEVLDQAQQAQFISNEIDVDAKLYDGFFSNSDKYAMSAVRATDAKDIANLTPSFDDNRLDALLPLYKARNFFSILNNEERKIWDKYRVRKLLSGGENSVAARFFTRLEELGNLPDLSTQNRYILEELQLYAQSILPYL